MAHARQAIRDAIVTLLTNLDTTGARVYRSRVYPMDTAKLPGLCIYTKTEQSEPLTMGSNRTFARTLTVSVEAYVKGLTNYDNSLDDICAEVEAAIAADRNLGGLAMDMKVTSFQADYSGDGEQPVATASMDVEVMYHTKELTPETSA